MKKTIFALLLLGSGSALMAQETQMGKTDNTAQNTTNDTYNSMNRNDDSASIKSSSSHSAYGNTMVNVPGTVQLYFQRDYPEISDAQWEQSNGWWHANYNNNGQNTNVYYNESGQSYKVALPVIENNVPASVVNTLLNKYGNNIYDITSMFTLNEQNKNSIQNSNTSGDQSMNTTNDQTLNNNSGQEVYKVRISENGQMRTEFVGADGSTQEYGSTQNNSQQSVENEATVPSNNTQMNSSQQNNNNDNQTNQ